MLEHYLGIIIDNNGNYMTFGKFDFLKQTGINGHTIAFLYAMEIEILKNNFGFLLSEEDMESFKFQDFYAYCQGQIETDFIFLLHGCSSMKHDIYSFFPIRLSNEQKKTLLELEKDILFCLFGINMVNHHGEKSTNQTIESVFEEIKKEQKVRRRIIE